MADRPHIVIAHDLVGPPTGMGRVVAWAAATVLAQDWRLTLVASEVNADLPGPWTLHRVRERTRLPSLPRRSLWAAEARQALRGVSADVVHVHSPALLGMADVMTCHYLAAPAHELGVRPSAHGRARAFREAQHHLNRRLDDRFYRARPPSTYLTFVSEFLLGQFERRYGMPRGGRVLPPPAPRWAPVSAAERAAARARRGIGPGALVAGYVGGSSPGKGLEPVLDLASRTEGDALTVLVAGPGTETVRWPGGRGLGLVDLDDLLGACDILLAPAVFDAAPVAVTQAVARGIRVVVSPGCGWAEPAARHGAGVVWDGEEDLADAARRAASLPIVGCRSFTAELQPDLLADRLLDVYTELLRDRADRRRARPAPGAEARS